MCKVAEKIAKKITRKRSVCNGVIPEIEKEIKEVIELLLCHSENHPETFGSLMVGSKEVAIQKLEQWMEK